MINQGKKLIKKMPGVSQFLQTNAYGSLRFSYVLSFSHRRNETFTRFLRLPSQYDALVGPVVGYFHPEEITDGLTITVIGCSNGAEVYSIASMLKNRHPHLRFTVKAVDIDEKQIEKAIGANYSADEVYANKKIPAWFVQNTFDIEKNNYRVKKSIKDTVSFKIADALDPNLQTINGPSDIVYAQNFLFHFKPKVSKKAFKNIISLLKPHSALFVDGMDLGLRSKLTQLNKLEPLEYKTKEIHEEARTIRGRDWPWIYWGLEPFSISRRNWRRRYSTIFLRDKF